jgi:hypothetical protein
MVLQLNVMPGPVSDPLPSSKRLGRSQLSISGARILATGSVLFSATLVETEMVQPLALFVIVSV